MSDLHLSELRRRRGAAHLDGTDHAALDAEIAKAALAAEVGQDAEAAKVARERATAATAMAGHKAEQRARLKGLEKKRIEALQAAEEGARGLAAAIDRAITITAEMASVTHEVVGRVPTPLSDLGFASRLGNRIAAVLSTIKGHKHRIGSLQLHHSMCKASDSWAVEEARLLDPHLKPILQEK
jgi:hypothetical protein